MAYSVGALNTYILVVEAIQDVDTSSSIATSLEMASLIRCGNAQSRHAL